MVVREGIRASGCSALPATRHDSGRQTTAPDPTPQVSGKRGQPQGHLTGRGVSAQRGPLILLFLKVPWHRLVSGKRFLTSSSEMRQTLRYESSGSACSGKFLRQDISLT